MRTTSVKFIVDGQAHEIDTASELSINRHDIDSEMARQAATYAWYRVLYERARHQMREANAELEDTSDEVGFAIREDARFKKATETAIKEAIRKDPRVRIAMRSARLAESNERYLWAIVNALEHRKDMLISLSRSRHHEMSALSADEVERIKENLIGRQH